MSIAINESDPTFFQTIIQYLNDIVWITDTDFRILHATPAVEKNLGFQPQELIGRTATELVRSEDRVELDKQRYKTLNAGSMITPAEIKLRHKNGGWIDVELVIHDLVFSPPINGLLIIARNITRRKQNEESRLKTELYYRKLFDDAPIMYLTTRNQAGQPIITDCNNLFVSNLGYPREVIIGKSIHHFYTEESQQQLYGGGGYKRAIEGKFDLEERDFISREGKIINALIRSIPDLDSTGRTIGTKTMYLDITRLKKAEENYRLVIENANEAIFINQDGRFVFVNPKLLEITGYEKADFLQGDIFRYVHPDDRAMTLNYHIRRFSGENVPNKYEFRIVCSSSQIRWVEVNVVLIQIDGRPATLNFMTDIHERKLAEAELQQSLKLETALFQIARASSLVPDVKTLCEVTHKELGAVLDAGNFYVALWDEEKELLEFPFFMDQKDPHPGVLAPGKGTIAYVLNSGRPQLLTIAEINSLTEKGELSVIGSVPKIWLGVPLSFENKLIGVMAIYHYDKQDAYTCRDLEILEFLANQISETIAKKRTEEALRQSQTRYRELFDNSPLGFYRTTPDGELLMANPALLDMLGFTSIQELSRNSLIQGSFSGHNYNREDLLAQINSEGKVAGWEAEWTRPDGTILYLRENARAIFDDSGGLCYIEGTVEDISQQKDLENQLQQSQKMEAIGHLAGGVAHDFNNMLGGILGFAELAQSHINDHAATGEYLDNIIEKCSNAATLVQQLLAFSRQQVLNRQVLNLNTVIKGSIKFLQRVIGENIRIIRNLNPDIDLIKADLTALDQIITNICLNARDAMPDGGTLSIQTDNITVDNASIPNNPVVVAGRFVCLKISDTGCGMDELVQQRIFEPFFTTKDVGKGTGLGMSMVYGLTKQHDGFINIISSPGQGSTIELYFPAHQAESNSHEQKATSKVPGGRETILVVEDDCDLLVITEALLKNYGYKVFIATDGNTAYGKFLEHQAEIRLVITDVIMPEISGVHLFEKIRALNSEVRFLFMTGYAPDTAFYKKISTEQQEIIQKPIRGVILADKVREILDKK
ncbi:MAG: PAS domain S-box protein [Candidatus Neomarinimicrobiota bacterium]